MQMVGLAGSRSDMPIEFGQKPAKNRVYCKQEMQKKGTAGVDRSEWKALASSALRE